LLTQGPKVFGGFTPKEGTQFNKPKKRKLGCHQNLPKIIIQKPWI